MAPSYTYNITIEGLSDLVKGKLALICNGADEKEQFRKRVKGARDHEVKPKAGVDKHQPNDFLAHCDACNYGIAIEVAFSQKSEMLPDLACFYIFEARRKTQMVIAIDIDYTRTKQITLRVWRPNHSNPAAGQLDYYSQELRTKDGARVPGPPLRISVFDLALQSIVPTSLHGAIIEITVDELCEEVEDGEYRHLSQKKDDQDWLEQRDEIAPQHSYGSSANRLISPDSSPNGIESSKEFAECTPTRTEQVDLGYLPGRSRTALEAVRSPTQTPSRTRRSQGLARG